MYGLFALLQNKNIKTPLSGNLWLSCQLIVILLPVTAPLHHPDRMKVAMFMECINK